MCDTQKSAIGGNVLRGAALVLAALAFVRPQESVQGALDGLSMCARQVIPALFPLMVLSQLLLTSGAAAMFAFPLRAYTRVLGVCSPSAGSAVALGWLGGFACGAQQIGSLRRQEVITRRDAELLLCCTIGSGPAFVVNAVGTLMLGSTLCGALLLTSLLAANLVTGTVMSRILKCGSHPDALPRSPVPTSFPGAVRSAAEAMLTLCGFVVFFSFASRVFFPPQSPFFLRWAAAALLEVTNACRTAAISGGSARVALCCLSLSLLGASVLFQIRSLLPDDVRLSPLVLSRLIHAPVSLACLALLLRIFPSAVPACAPARMWMPADAATSVFPMLCVVLFSFPRLRRNENRV